MNANGNSISIDGLPEEDRLSDLDRQLLMEVFFKPVSSETIFLLISLLKLSSPAVINQIFKLYLEFLNESAKSKISKSAEIRVSQGIYFCMILRFKPLLSNIYIDKQHFLMVGWKAFYPYINMFIIYFLIPCIIGGANIEENLREVSAVATQPMAVLATGNKPVEPIRSFPNFSSQTIAQMNAMRERIGNPANYGSESNGEGSPPGRSTSPTSGSGEGSPPLQMPVIAKLVEMCNISSPERKGLGELRRIHNSGPGYYFSRLGLKSQRTELAIFMDIQSLLDEPLTEDDVQKAIFMHSNQLLKSDGVFAPHHFDRSVSCLNYEMARHTFEIADWIRTETLDELIFLSKELKHAVCLELLLLAVQKNVSLCKHHLKRIPAAWQARVLDVYTRPRWKSVKLPPKSNGANSGKDQPPGMGDRSVGEELGVNATMEYYKACLGFTGSYHDLLDSLPAICEKMVTDDSINDFLGKSRRANQSYYILELSGCLDFFADRKLTFANPKDMMEGDIFDVPKNFIYPYREGEFIYLFDYNTFETIIKTGKNPYNRAAIRPDALEAMTERYQRFNIMGFSSTCWGMTDIVKEMVSGRVIEQSCPCGAHKDYVKKLARSLRSYGVKVESFDVINLNDALFKLSLMSLDFNADSIPQLCANLYRAIKSAGAQDREELKQSFASVILLYSKYSGANYIVGI